MVFVLLFSLCLLGVFGSGKCSFCVHGFCACLLFFSFMLDKTWSFTLEMFADSTRTWWRIILKSGYLVHKVRHVCVLVTWKCNLTWSFKIPALFSRPWQLFWGRRRAELFWWSRFRDRFQSTARQATACPSIGDGSQGGGTPKLTLLSVEQEHSAKATGGALWSSLSGKFLSSVMVYWLLCHASTVVYWSCRHHLWKDCVKTYFEGY